MSGGLPLVPVAASADGREVELHDLRGGDFSLPFLADSVTALKADTHRLRVTLSLELVRSLAPPPDCGSPPLLLLHAGRCGSTLLSTMIGHLLGVPVAREPEAATTLLARYALHHDLPLEAAADVLRLVSTSLGAAHDPPAPHALVKLSAWQTTLANRLLPLLAETPAIFLVRDPLPTVASMLHSAPPWFDHLWSRDPGSAAAFFPTRADTRTSSEPHVFLAVAWASIVEAALAVPAAGLTFVAYERLIAEPSETLRFVCRQAGLPWRRDRLEGALRLLDLYAKAPGGGQRFDPAGLHQRPRLPDPLAEKVDEITAEVRSAASTRAAEGHLGSS